MIDQTLNVDNGDGRVWVLGHAIAETSDDRVALIVRRRGRAADGPLATIPVISAHEIMGTVLDVRQAGEYRTGHLPDARNIELGAIPATPMPDGPVTVMCGHGERAMTAASVLAKRGHTDPRVLEGGPDDWANATGEQLESST